MAAKFVLKASGSQFMFNLCAANGQVVLTSERYKQKASAKKGIASVKKCAASDARFDRRKAKNGKPYFVLMATNGEPIGKSQMYSAASSMERGIASVKNNAPGAAIDDRT